MSRRRRNKSRPGRATAEPPKTQSAQADTGVLVGVVACFVLSGFAALLYQTAWMRQFSIVFGTSELAVATVLSAYMAGLALGAAVAARLVDRITRPVLVYGLLEAGVALSALAVPLLLALANTFYIGVLGDQPSPADATGLGQSFFYLLVAFVVLAIPTGCMGATLPMLTKYVVRTEAQIGPRVGLLYAMNTVGAVGGTVTAGFLLLPALGLSGTVWVGVAVNAIVFLIAARLARSITPAESMRARAVPTVEPRRRLSLIGSTWILPLMLLSGANTFTYEVLWTRLLGHFLGGSIAAFAAMLASFLSGIAIGSAIAARFATSRHRAVVGFILAQIGIAATSIAIYQLLPLLIPESMGLSGNVVLAIAILLPATLFVGATFPFAVRILAKNGNDAASSSARVYAWNTIGAIVGAAIAGFILIPLLRYEGAIELAVTINIVLALAASTLILRKQFIMATGSAILLLAVVVAYHPLRPEAILRSSPIADSRGGEIRYYEVGRSATVLVLEEDGYLNLRTNGLPEASTNLKGAPPYQHNQHLLSALPVLARPDTRDMLIVGFGAGVAVESVPPSVASVDVIELEPKVIDANRLIGPERQIDPLQDDRVNIYINDARSALALTSKQYDAIVSQPSHPWTAGASHLYTREFMALTKEHLNAGGVFLQWMNTQFMTESVLRSLCATLLDVFPYARIYQFQPEILFFLGSDEPFDIERAIAQTGRPLRDDPQYYLERGIGAVEDLLIALAMDQDNIERFASGSTLLTDDFNRMATESAVAREKGDTLSFRELTELFIPYNPLLQTDSWIYEDFPGDLEYSYISDRLERLGMKRHAVELAYTLERLQLTDAPLLIGMGLERQGENLESQRVLLSALLADQENDQARYAVLRPWLTAIARGDAPEYALDIAAGASGSVAAVLEGWKAADDKNWQALVELDDTLATVRPTDLWYLQAAKLRADWRIKVTTPGFQPRFAREATRLIDNAIALYQDPDFYSMRVAAAFVADDAMNVIETARRLIYIFGNTIDRVEKGLFEAPPQAYDVTLRQIESVRAIVNETRRKHDIPRYKTEQLDSSLRELVDRLDAARDRDTG
jgi:spermidine synthase